MRIEINKSENVELLCQGKLIAEFNVGGLTESSYHLEEIQRARVSLVLAKKMAKVTDWDAFSDGVKNVLREHSYGGLPGYVAPADPKTTPGENQAYRADWDIGEFVRRYISEDTLDLFGEEAA